MTTLRPCVRFAVLASLVATPMSTTLATPVLTSGDADIKVIAPSGELETEWHVAEGAIVSGTAITAQEYPLNGLIASGTTTVLANSFQASMLGVSVDTRVVKMGEDAFQPKIGWGNDSGESITVTFKPDLSSFPTGGHFAMASGTTAVFSSYNPLITGAANSFEIEDGQHQHYDWLFSKEGTYQLHFNWTGGGDTTDGSITVQAVPEPSTVAMLAIGGGMVTIAALRRVRRSCRTTSA